MDMTENKNMHLEHVKIEGFKSIKSLELDIKPINILLGANGSGKSNFISLFTFLRNLSEGKLQNYVQRNGYANTFFHFGTKNTPQIQIDIAVGYNGYHVTFEHNVDSDALMFAKEYCTIKSSTTDWDIKGVKGESGLLPNAEAKSEGVKIYTREYLEECRVYHFHDTSNTAGFKQAADVDASDYLYPNANNIAPFLHRLKDSKNKDYTKSYSDIIDAIKTVAPYFKEFRLNPRGDDGKKKLLLKWQHYNHEEPFSANQLSDGTARFICMAVLFLQPEELMPKTIILDEPELGLHPAALEVLAELVKSAAKKKQVICSTQSVTFANQFEAKDFIIVDRVEGASEFKRVNEEELKSWLEDYAMGDIWTKNLIGGRPEW